MCVSLKRTNYVEMYLNHIQLKGATHMEKDAKNKTGMTIGEKGRTRDEQA